MKGGALIIRYAPPSIAALQYGDLSNNGGETISIFSAGSNFAGAGLASVIVWSDLVGEVRSLC